MCKKGKKASRGSRQGIFLFSWMQAGVFCSLRDMYAKVHGKSP